MREVEGCPGAEVKGQLWDAAAGAARLGLRLSGCVRSAPGFRIASQLPPASAADANKYFPQARSAGMKAGGEGKRGSRGRRKKINWSRAFSITGACGGGGGGEMGLSRRMNNEACFQHFKGKGGEETVKLRYVLRVDFMPNSSDWRRSRK